MRPVIGVLLWVGIFMAVREWLYARKHGLPITLAEKLYPALAFVLVVAADLVMFVIGISPETAAAGVALSIAVILSLWAMQRRVRRTARGL